MVLFCDGASRGNPGPSAYGFVLCRNSSETDIIEQEGKTIGTVTNNVAEYRGLIEGLRRAKQLGANNILVKSDSELLVRQVNGIYKVRAPHILPLFKEAKELLKYFKSYTVSHIRREENSLADELCNLALDGNL